MHVAINTLAVQRRPHGVGSYVRNLARRLAALDRENQYTLYVSPENAVHFEGLGPNVRLVQGPAGRPRRALWEQAELPLDLVRRQVDLFHGPGFVVPLFGACPRIVTLHDMTFSLFPREHTFARRHYFNVMVPLSARAADIIIAISESTRTDLVRLLGVKPEKVRVIHLAAGEEFRPGRDPDRLLQVRRKYGIERRMILYLGMIEPRKNLQRLVGAFARLKDLREECCLVLAGSLGWGGNDLLRAVEAHGLKEEVILPGYLDDADLPALYSAAEVFVYPSLYEGFGIPVLEAMACGTPVITSKVSSMPEIAGDAAVLVDPLSVDDLAGALSRVLLNKNQQQQMSERGLQRSRQFTWERTARETLRAYRELAG